MPTRDRSRSSRRRGSGDDIPLARRRLAAAQPQSRAVRFSRLLPLALIVASGTAALVLGPLRPWLLPPPVPGLAARLSPDGRLLGHLPYDEAPEAALVSIGPEHRLRADAAEAFEAMRRAAAADGIDLQVISAYRSKALQRHVFFDVGAERNQAATVRARVSAPPGYSEHSTGYAIDIGDPRRPDTHLSPSFDQTGAYAWLAANAARFHFTLSFPRGNAQGVSYEPWHWRYEGSTDALRVFDAAHRLSSR